MNSHTDAQRRRAAFRVINGGENETPPATAEREAPQTAREFLLKLETAGLNVDFYTNRLDSFADQPNPLKEIVDLQIRLMQKHEGEQFENFIVQAEYILSVYETCLELERAEVDSPEAIDTKKQAQLEIYDEEGLIQTQKNALQKVLNDYSPHLKGLNLKDPAEVAHFRTHLPLTEIKASDATVISLELAREHFARRKPKE